MPLAKDEHFGRGRVLRTTEDRIVGIVNFEGVRRLRINFNCFNTVRAVEEIV
jgi:hypothetical protein